MPSKGPGSLTHQDIRRHLFRVSLNLTMLPAQRNHRNSLDYTDTLLCQGFNLVGIVRQNSHTLGIRIWRARSETEVSKNGACDFVTPFIRFMAEHQVRGNSVVSHILQVIRSD